MEKEISSRDENGYYRIGDNRYMSVTTALSLLSDFSKVDPSDLKKAAEFGKAAHDMVDKYERKRLNINLDNELRPLLKAWISIKKEHEIEVIKTELKIYSTRYIYAGTLDVLAMVKGIRSVIEIKTRPYNCTTDALQTAAYQQAYNEMNPKAKALKRFFCGLFVGGEKRFFEIKKKSSQPDNFQLFLSALAIKKWSEL
jgi:hypothetical protein